MARHNLAHDPAPGGDRRAEPRVAVAFPASIRDGHLQCSGQVIDAAEHGVLIQLTEVLLWDVAEATITLRLPASEPWEVRATAIRRDTGESGRPRIALRMSAGRQGPLPRRRTPSRRTVTSLAELGTRAYELTVIDPATGVPDALGRALGEIGGAADPPPATARDLLAAIARLGEGYSPDQPR
jgi:hypothetical protein